MLLSGPPRGAAFACARDVARGTTPGTPVRGLGVARRPQMATGPETARASAAT
jgi:hypothetical protein